MKYTVVITEPAERDIYNAAVYIADNLTNKTAAMRFVETAEKELTSLADFPERNSLVRDPFLAASGIRMQLINNYLAFYVIREETRSVTVLRVLHSRRDWLNILTNDIDNL